MRGHIFCTGEVTIKMEGRYVGTIDSEKVTIERKSEIEFPKPLKAREIVINGNVTGDMLCRGKVTINKHGALNGNIYARAVVIEKGGVFNGMLNIGETAFEDALQGFEPPEPPAPEPPPPPPVQILRMPRQQSVVLPRESTDPREQPAPGASPAPAAAGPAKADPRLAARNPLQKLRTTTVPKPLPRRSAVNTPAPVPRPTPNLPTPNPGSSRPLSFKAPPAEQEPESGNGAEPEPPTENTEQSE